ncbi:MAG TPA: hypothetical protein VLG11_00395 [Candidatus Saccharimonadales bacterium]|nr:hypothetical protein [Candidatus Saccharimonadales bacterium]
MTKVGELITVVNGQNREVGAAPLSTVLRSQHIHRRMWGVVSTADGGVLVRRRSDTATLHPSRYDMGVAAAMPSGQGLERVVRTSFLRQAGLLLLNHRVEYLPPQYHETETDLPPIPPLARLMRRQFATVVKVEAHPDDVQPEKIPEPLWMHPEEIRSLAQKEPERVTPELHVIATEYL